MIRLRAENLLHVRSWHLADISSLSNVRFAPTGIPGRFHASHRHKGSGARLTTGNLSAITVPVGKSQGLELNLMPTTPLIAYAHVGKTFDDGRVVAVDDVSLDVAEGEFLAIVGGSGSGKTTLLRLTNRLIEADGGTITVEGEDVRNVDPIPLRRRIGYVFQSGGLFPHLSVAGNVGITPKLLGTSPAEISARSEEHTSELQSLAYLVCRLLLEK